MYTNHLARRVKRQAIEITSAFWRPERPTNGLGLLRNAVRSGCHRLLATNPRRAVASGPNPLIFLSAPTSSNRREKGSLLAKKLQPVPLTLAEREGRLNVC